MRDRAAAHAARPARRSPRRPASAATRTPTGSRSTSPRPGGDRAPDAARGRDAAVGKRTALAPRPPADLETQYGMAASKGAKALLEELEVRTRTRSTWPSAPTGARCGSPARPRAASIVVDAATRAKVAEIPVGGQADRRRLQPRRHAGLRHEPARRQRRRRSTWPTRKVLQTLPVGRRAARRRDRSAGQDAVRARHLLRRRLGGRHRDAARRRSASPRAAARGRGALARRQRGCSSPTRSRASASSARRRCPRSRCSTGRPAGRGPLASCREANLLLGVAWHPSGEFALATLNRTKNLVPMTRILQGWTITNGLAVLWKDGRVDQVLLDEPQRYFADVTDVAFTPDGRTALVTSAGTDQRGGRSTSTKLVALVDAAAPTRTAASVLPNWLGASAEFVDGAHPGEGQPARHRGRARRRGRRGSRTRSTTR